MSAENSSKEFTIRIIARLLIFLVLTGISSLGLSVDAEGRIGDVPAEKRQIILSRVQVFDPAAGVLQEAQDILIEGEQIKALGRRDAFQKDTSYKDATKIDLNGKFVLPGLFECHTHLAFLPTNSEEEMIKELRAFVCNGITQVRDLGGPIDIVSRMSERISKGEILGPKMFYSGPQLQSSPLFYARKNETLPGFTVSINSKEDVDRVLTDLARKGACMVKTYNRMDLDVYKHLLDVAQKYGLRPVHDPGRYLYHSLTMDTVMDMGVTSIEHCIAPWPLVLKDELKKQHDHLMATDADEAARDALMTKVIELGVDSISLDKLQRLLDKMLEHNVYICPTLWIYGYEDIFTPFFIKHGVKILVGHDGPSPTKLFWEMKKLMELGLSEVEILRGVTIYPAQWLGVEDSFGSIVSGTQANLLILDRNPLDDIANIESAHMVLKNGQVVFNKEEYKE
ncbi:MAG: amidohydrolase family protein [Candidatus Aminicenantaceae bacterium]